MSFEIPYKGDKVQTGRIAYESVELAYTQDSLWPRARARASQSYLKGMRNFQVIDPYDPGRTLLKVELEDGYPTHDAVVSETNSEIGKQQRMDVRPVTSSELMNTIEAARDKAVGQGILSYHFNSRVIDRSNRLFQRGRVIDGVSGLAVCPTVYPSFGWGLKVITIPMRELCFLPIGCSDEEAGAIVWRRWLPLSVVKEEIDRLSKIEVSRISQLPLKGTEDYHRLNVKQIPYGEYVTEQEDTSGLSSTLFGGKTSTSFRSPVNTDSKGRRHSPFVLFTQIFFSNDFVFLNRKMVIVGEHLIYDMRYPELERPMMPIAKSTYADVGGPFGSPFTYARMMVNIRDEGVLTTLLRNFNNTDAYGLIALSQGMGLNIADMFKQGNGMKVVHYQTDPNSASTQPLQITPIPMERMVGRALGLMRVLTEGVFPDSPLNQGRSVGRVDSDRAIARLDQLGQTSMRAGAESARSAWVQIYRAGLEMARNHHKKGEKVPIFQLSPELAGVIVDTEQIPLAEGEQQKKRLRSILEMEQVVQSGGDPLMSQELSGITDTSPRTNLVPVARFTIGPNVIPHPSQLTIDIRSMLPRDPQTEFDEIMAAVQIGASSIMEAQIEMMERGIERFMGGRMVRATYKTAVLNLLSAFGDGVEAGPILIQPHIFSTQVGYWIIASFIADTLFGLASATVKNQVMQLLFMYSPVNQVGSHPSADEAASMFMMEQRRRMAQQQGLSNQLPQMPEGAMG